MSHKNRGNGNYVLMPARGDCPTGKVQFASRKQARVAAKRHRDSALGVFRCDCGSWHLGHLPQRVRNGAVDKQAWLAATKGRNA